LGAGITPEQLNDDTLGKTLDALHAYDVSALYNSIAARAVRRLGLTPWVGHKDITRFRVDGRYHSAEPPAPEAGIVHIKRSSASWCY